LAWLRAHRRSLFGDDVSVFLQILICALTFRLSRITYTARCGESEIGDMACEYYTATGARALFRNAKFAHPTFRVALKDILFDRLRYSLGDTLHLMKTDRQ